MHVRILLLLSIIIGLTSSNVSCTSGENSLVTSSMSHNRWLNLLNLIPDNDFTQRGVYLQDYALLDEKVSQFSKDADKQRLIFNLPLFGTDKQAYSDEEWQKTLGFTKKDVTGSIYSFVAPSIEYQAVFGNFNKDTINRAVNTGPGNDIVERVIYRGYEFYSWGIDREIIPSLVGNVRSTGMGYRLGLIDDFVIWVSGTNIMREMIDSYCGYIDSLADREDYQLLADELNNLGTVNAFFSSESRSISYIEEITKLSGVMGSEIGQRFEDNLKSVPLLKFFQSFAVGSGIDENGIFLAILLLNESEDRARENGILLQQRLAQVVQLYSGNRWADNITQTIIQNRQLVTIAKLYGNVYSFWDNFALNGIATYEPLLVYE